MLLHMQPPTSKRKTFKETLSAILFLSLLIGAVLSTSCSGLLPGSTADNSTDTSGINAKTGVYGEYYLGMVRTSGGILSGDGCYDDKGKFVVLINNKNAVDPTYDQMVAFLQSDTTDEFPYVFVDQEIGSYYNSAESHVDLQNVQAIIDGTAQPGAPDICSDFAERLHNDAELAGIRCAFVALDVTGYTDPSHLGIPADSGHACDAFQTTDRGLIYVDDTGTPAGAARPTRMVSTVDINVGQEYIPINLFPEKGWQAAGASMGTVSDVQVVWDGEWSTK